MIKELSEETLDVCVCAIHKGALPYIAHCLRLELIGEGQTRQQAISRLEGLIKLQCRTYQSEAVSLWLGDVDSQWEEYHIKATGIPEERVLDVRGHTNDETVQLRLSVRTSHTMIRNTDAWPTECPLGVLSDLLSARGISCISDEPGCVHLVGRWQNASDVPLQSYPFHVPADRSVAWYHLRAISRRFGLDDLQTILGVALKPQQLISGDGTFNSRPK